MKLILLFLFYLGLVRSYILKCPGTGQWRLRSTHFCERAERYVCLYNVIDKVYVENCNGPRRETIGDKTVININGRFDNVYCSNGRFQPAIFSTSEGSECVFKKSTCSEEGQLISSNGSSFEDITCKCDYTRGYQYLSSQRHDHCSCKPLNEDCSCQIHICGEGETLSRDYTCVNNSESHTNFECSELYINQTSEEKRSELKFLTEKNDKEASFLVFNFVVLVIIFSVGLLLLYNGRLLDQHCYKVYIVHGLHISSPAIQGKTVILQCKLSKSAKKTAWYKDDEELIGMDTVHSGNIHTLTLHQLGKNSKGHYTFVADKLASELYLNVTPLFKCDIKYKEIEDNNIELTCDANELEKLATWYKDGKKIKLDKEKYEITKDKERQMLVIKNPEKSDAGCYSVSLFGVSETILIDEKHILFERRLKTVSCMESLYAVLSCKIQDTKLLAAWFKDGERIRSSRRIQIKAENGVHTVEIIATDKSDQGVYRIVIDKYASQAELKITALPDAIKQMSKEEIKQYVEIARQGTELRHHIRVMLIGKSRAGKTSLLHRILNEGIDNICSTDGVDFKYCKIRLSDEKWVTGESEMNESRLSNTTLENSVKFAHCDFWDFAGQREFYATHQTFLTSNAIYLLVVDMLDIQEDTELKENKKRREETSMNYIGDFTDYWFDTIHCYATENDRSHSRRNERLNPPVIVVGTGTDKLKNEDMKAQCINSLRNHLLEILKDQQKIGHYRDLICVSNLHPEKDTFDKIRKKIFRIAKQMPTWQEQVPRRWLLLEGELNLKRRDNNIVTFDIIKKIAADSVIPVNDEQELLFFLKVQHEVGNIIFFSEIKEYVILNVKWLVDAFRCLVSPADFQRQYLEEEALFVIKETGKIDDKCIDDLFGKVPKLKFGEYRGHILNVMEKFDIIVKPNKEDIYYIPCMMKSGVFNEICTSLGVSDSSQTKHSKVPTKSLWLCLEFAFLPPAFFNHILVNLTRQYRVSSEEQSRLAFYRCVGVFDLDASSNTQLALCTSGNTIAIQMWVSNSAETFTFVSIRQDIEIMVEELATRYKMKIKYEVKFKCEDGSYNNEAGKRNFAEIVSRPSFKCPQHHTQHDWSKLMYMWFDEKKKKKSRSDQGEERCYFCKGPPTVGCTRCDINLCYGCKSKHHSTNAESDHDVQSLCFRCRRKPIKHSGVCGKCEKDPLFVTS